MKDRKPIEVREDVAKAYAGAIQSSDDACCAPGCCAPKNPLLTPETGYSPRELAVVNTEVAVSSLGCGNPLAFAEVRPGQTVVDLGSGAGLDLLLAAERVGPTGRVIGVDMTDAMIERARANVAEAGVGNVEVRKGLIEEMPLPDASADWVISNCVINLSPEKGRVFEEIARVLKPGGRVQVSDIVVEDLQDWVQQSTDLFTACVGGAISESDYLEGMRGAGLVDAEVIERVVFDAATIRSFLDSEELPTVGDDLAKLSPGDRTRMVESLAGKVWSAKVRARKP